MLNAGYAPGYVQGNAQDMLKNPVVKQEYERKFLQVLKKKGIDDTRLAQCIDEGLKAQRPTTFQGQIVDWYDDHYIRERYVQDILKVRGDFAPDQLNIRVGKEQAETTFEERVRRMREIKNGQNQGCVDPPKEGAVEGEYKDMEDKELEG